MSANNSKPNRGASERTPLINGGPSPTDDNNGNNHYPTQSSDTMTFLFNSEHTPGKDSENFAVRALAYSWHVAKVTLLSSKSFLCKANGGCLNGRMI